MANSRFDYVRNFEQNDAILPNCWIVVRIDGKAFHKFTQKHDFNKPNDDNGKCCPSPGFQKFPHRVIESNQIGSCFSYR